MEEIQLTLEENIATITINRPSVKNAITSEMWDELQRIFIELGYRDDVRAVIVTGAGDDFCSGADVSGMASRSEGHRLHQLARAQLDPIDRHDHVALAPLARHRRRA